MDLSVIVTSYGSPETLRRCLESLDRQQDAAEIVVADCSPQDPAPKLAIVFPRVRFLHFSSKQRVPQLRWSALPHTSREVVAAVEARCVPEPDWCAILKRAHELNPEAPAIGGPVRVAAGAGAMETALYLCEYGHYAPPACEQSSEVASSDLSGANLSYKRAALEAERDLLDGGRWETLLHLRWRQHGRPLLLSRATVEFHNTMRLADIVRQRFSYGRGYAADRVERRPVPIRLAYAAFTLLLPALLVVRVLRDAKRSRIHIPGPRPLLWCVLFTTCWSAGEAVGYLFGSSSHQEIY